MKNGLLFLFISLSVASCSTRIPYTDALKKEFNLDDEKRIKQVQFYTSTEIIMNRSYSSGSKGTQEGGTLVMNKNSREDRIIIPPSTKCIFEKFGEEGEIYIRFELGTGKILKFIKRNGTDKYYLDAQWVNGKGEVIYGNRSYTAVNPSSFAFLVVQMKKLQQTQRTDRIVKGIKVN
jgi:hypothetical protein